MSTDLATDKFPTERLGLITGSACSVLLPKRSAEKGVDTYARMLAMQKTFSHYDEISSWQMEHGNYAEYHAMNHYKQYHDKSAFKPEFVKDGVFGGSADCLTDTSGVDFKCPTTMQTWLNYLIDGISYEQECQCQMYMMLYKRDTWFIAAYLLETLRMGEVGLQYPVKEEKRMILIKIEKDPNFETKIKLIAPSVIEARDSYCEIFNQYK